MHTAAQPVYLAIQNALRDAIAGKRYGPGDRLPSETELAKRFNTTRATVVHALHALVFEGIVERRRGLGTFVAMPTISTHISDARRTGYFEADMFARGQDVTYEVQRFEPEAVSDHVRGELQLAASESVHFLQRVRRLAERPLAVELRYLPSSIAHLMPREALASLPLQDVFAQQLGISIDHIVNTVRVALVPADLCKPLEIARGRPVMVRAHTFIDRKGQPLLWGETVYREEYQLQYGIAIGG